MGTWYERRPSKYRAVKVENALGKFDSMKEANRYAELLLLQKAGRITDLRRQVKFVLIPSQTLKNGKHVPPISYVADFVYLRDGKEVVEDCKGYKTAVYQIKKKLMLYQYQIEIFES